VDVEVVSVFLLATAMVVTALIKHHQTAQVSAAALGNKRQIKPVARFEVWGIKIHFSGARFLFLLYV